MNISCFNQKYLDGSMSAVKKTASAFCSGMGMKNPIASDIFVKKQGGISLTAAVGDGGVVGRLRSKKIERILTAGYNKLADNISEKMQKKGYNFVKPHLSFNQIDDSTIAHYCMDRNEIVVNSSFLNVNNFYKNKGREVLSLHVDELDVNLCDYFVHNPSDELKNKMRKGSLSEMIMCMRSHLAHELEHAKQIQYSLHADGARDLILEIEKAKYPNLSDEDIINSIPFIFNFSPKRKISLDGKISTGRDILIKLPSEEKPNPKFFHFLEKNEDGDIFYVPVFTPRMMIQSLVGRDDKENIGENYSAYIKGLHEILALRAEYRASKLHVKNVDEDVAKIFSQVAWSNYSQMLEYLLRIS